MTAESEGSQKGQKRQLSSLPEELNHFNLDSFHDRPVQADLVRLLLLPKEDPAFSSCVLVHGMGGTGKVRVTVQRNDLSFV